MLADTRADSPDRHARAVHDLHEPSGQRESDRLVCPPLLMRQKTNRALGRRSSIAIAS